MRKNEQKRALFTELGDGWQQTQILGCKNKDLDSIHDMHETHYVIFRNLNQPVSIVFATPKNNESIVTWSGKRLRNGYRVYHESGNSSMYSKWQNGSRSNLGEYYYNYPLFQNYFFSIFSD